MNFFFVGSLTTFLLIGLPVAFALALIAVLAMLFFDGGFSALTSLPIIAFSGLDDFTLTALPMYILMSQVLVISGIGKDLFEMASRWFRHLPGGLGIATVFCCAIFSAISGSSVATAVTVGAIALPEMLRRGYDRKFVLGLLAAGGTLGILIPPSIPMIVYGSITGESVGDLFIAGVVPGIVLTVAFMLISSYLMRDIKDEPATWPERWEGTKKAIWGLLLPVIIVGGIYSGVFTPTEAAAVGVVVAFLVAIIVYKSINLERMKEILLSTVKINAMVLFIMIGAKLLGYMLTNLQIPQAITEFALSIDVSKWVIFILINVLLLILGMFLETISILVITLPIVYPIIIGLGFDPIWFAVIMVVNLELALITPPVGMNLFVLRGLDRENSLAIIMRGVIPYVIAMLLFIIVLAFVPEIATYLVERSG